MDRQFYFRSLLLKIYNRLSKDDQHRFHFLVGDHIPRVQREDVTLPGTLAVFELLIDRALLNEDELDFLIQIFLQLRCYEAVKLLRGVLKFFFEKKPEKNYNSKIYLFFRISKLERITTTTIIIPSSSSSTTTSNIL